MLFYLQVKLLAMCRMALLCWWPKSGLAQVAGGDLISSLDLNEETRVIVITFLKACKRL